MIIICTNERRIFTNIELESVKEKMIGNNNIIRVTLNKIILPAGFL